jgi:hypothetical protein
MNFYFDEQLPKIVANALNILESHEVLIKYLVRQ